MVTNRSVPADIVLPRIAYQSVPNALEWLSKAFEFTENYRYGEPETGGAQMYLGNAMPVEKFTSSTFDALDKEILSVFSPKELITPDDVRGKHKTLEEAVLSNQWPTLKSAPGKVVFLMDQHPVGPVYLEGHPSLRGRMIFTNATPGQPDCAFIEENDGPSETIAALVRKGYLIRTRTDADTKEARTGKTAKRDAALASGAQLLSTDYPASEPSAWTGYPVSLPEGAVARCNPLNKPATCTDATLEVSASK